MLHSHFGVYAAILSKDLEKILLIIKARGPYTGRYDLPGGSIEALELLEDCLIREVKEETGCTVINAKQLQSISTIFKYNNGAEDCLLRHIGVIYRVEIEGTPKITGDGEDSNGCVWQNINNINEDTVTPFVSWVANYIKQQ